MLKNCQKSSTKLYISFQFSKLAQSKTKTYFTISSMSKTLYTKSSLGIRHKPCHTVTPYFRTPGNLSMSQQGSASKIFLGFF
jgi:hypothetical protein